MDIYTIGHSNYSTERLIDMLRTFNINCVVDIRAIPYSKYNTHFNKEVIQETLVNANFIYIYMAKEFGAKRDNKISYNELGYCDFEKVIEEDDFKNGIQRLKDGCKKGYNIALMGARQEPIRCHRGILVGRVLEREGFNVKHILDDYSIAYQSDIEQNILEKYFENRNQLTIDALLLGEKSDKDMIAEGYRLANKEIGYRLEKLKD